MATEYDSVYKNIRAMMGSVPVTPRLRSNYETALKEFAQKNKILDVGTFVTEGMAFYDEKCVPKVKPEVKPKNNKKSKKKKGKKKNG